MACLVSAKAYLTSYNHLSIIIILSDHAPYLVTYTIMPLQYYDISKYIHVYYISVYMQMHIHVPVVIIIVWLIDYKKELHVCIYN